MGEERVFRCQLDGVYESQSGSRRQRTLENQKDERCLASKTKRTTRIRVCPVETGREQERGRTRDRAQHVRSRSLKVDPPPESGLPRVGRSSLSLTGRRTRVSRKHRSRRGRIVGVSYPGRRRSSEREASAQSVRGMRGRADGRADLDCLKPRSGTLRRSSRTRRLC
jgi:hypothetical protein